MHTTLHPQIIGNTEVQTDTNARGWAFHSLMGSLPVRSVITHTNGDTIYKNLPRKSRKDVDKTYGGTGLFENCGWEYQENDIRFVELEMDVDGSWEVFYRYEPGRIDYILKISNKIPKVVVINDFYENPDRVRQFALGQKMVEHKNNHKGYRSDVVFRPEHIKKKFEQLLGKKITNWEKYGTNGCFQYCVEGNEIVYHCDSQQYAGAIYLTPDAPPDSGTSLYRSKKNKLMKLNDEHARATGKNFDTLFNETFGKGFLDESQFDLVDRIGNVYNRLVLWDGQMIHAASSYFGDKKENARLFQLFFFDVE